MSIRLFGIALIALILAGSPAHMARAQDVQPAQARTTLQATHHSKKKAVRPAVSLQKFLSDHRSVKSLGVKELRRKLRAGRALVKQGKLSRVNKRKVRTELRAMRARLFQLRPDLRKHHKKHKKHNIAELNFIHLA